MEVVVPPIVYVPPKRPDLVLALDPGDEHVGWACALRVKGLQWGIKAGEWTNAKSKAEVRFLCTELDVMVMEEFVLYPDKAAQQAYSPMRTAELIGAFRMLAEDRGIRVVMQGAYIKKPTRQQLVARGIKQVGVGNHARDAELHLLHWLLRQGEMEARSPMWRD